MTDDYTRSTAQVNTMRKIWVVHQYLARRCRAAGCGGNEPSSFAAQPASSSSTSTLSNVASIALVTNMPQIPSNGSTPATITAIAKNSNNAVVSGVPVVFATNSGVIAPVATATGTDVTPGTTDATGAAAASLSTPGDPTNRDITVTAAVGNISAQVVVAVVGTSISLTGPASLIQASTGTFNVSLTDSAGAGLAGYPVTVASASGNTLSASNLTTDSTGHATFTLTASKAGTDTVTAKALGLTASQSLSVSSQSFAFTAPSAGTNIALNAAQALSVLWTNSGAPEAGQAVTFSTTRGLFANNQTTTTATTDSTGTAGDTATPVTVHPRQPDRL